MTKSYKDPIEVLLEPGNREIIFEYEFKTPVISILGGSVGLNSKLEDFIKNLENAVKEKMVLESERLFNGKVFTAERIENSFVSAINGNTLLLDTNDVKWFGQDNKKCEPVESGTCIINVKRVKFDGKFSLDMKLSKVKAARKNEIIDFFNVETPEPDTVKVSKTEQDFW